MRQRHYETTVILKPEGGNDFIKQFAEKVNSIVEGMGGKIVDFHSWGEKKLAYEIKKNMKGHYLHFNHVSDGSVIFELERNFNIMEYVLKYMTVRPNENKNLQELLDNAKGITTLFAKSAEAPRREEKKVERKEVVDSKKYNEKLQDTLSKSKEEEEENVEL